MYKNLTIGDLCYYDCRLQEKIALKEKIKDQDISLLTEELVNLMIAALHKDE